MVIKMAILNKSELPEISIKYPAVAMDSLYGTTFSVDLKRTQGVLHYLLNFVLGTLTGGTSPAWTVSASNPLITHIKIEAENETILSLDSQIIELINNLVGLTSNGLTFQVDMTDKDIKTNEIFIETLLKSYNFTSLKMYITVAPLSAVTSGSPTGSTGTQLLMQEQDIERSLVTFPTYLVKKLQNSLSLPLTGENIITNALAQTGAYKSVLLFASTGNSYATASDSLISSVKLTINNQFVKLDEYWALIKAKNQSLYHHPMPTGYAFLDFMKSNNTVNMLHLSNVNAIKSIELAFTTTVSNGAVSVIVIEYMG